MQNSKLTQILKRFPLPLRISIPSILILGGAVLGILSFNREIQETYKKTEQNYDNYVRISAGQTSRILEYLYRRSDIEDASTTIVSQLGSDPNLNVVMVMDENNQVQLSNNYQLIEQTANQTPAISYLDKFPGVRNKLAGEILFSDDRNQLVAIYPVLLEVLPNELRPSRVGILFFEYDLIRAKKEAYNDALIRSLLFNSTLTIFCLVLWFFFEITLTRRASLLVTTTNKLAKGDLKARARLSGSDELVQISVAFDNMATEIEKNANLLQQQANQLQKELNERIQAEIKLRDINQKLSLTNEELARATRLKDQFLSTMSHELRTPLNGILGMAEVLQMSDLGGIQNEKQLGQLKIITDCGHHLLQLINDILDVTKLEAEEVKLNCHLLSIHEVCESSLQFIKSMAFKKRIDIHLYAPPNLPPINLDKRWMRQAFINLLNNAVKFTAEGGQVSFSITFEQSHPLPHSPYALRIAIKDNGIGIAPENLDKLFQPFVQIDSNLNRKYEGTGLGLTLVKKIIDLHQGTIGVSSELGVGSCFTIDLPCHELPPQVPAVPQTHLLTSIPSSGSGHSEKSTIVLLIEDNRVNIVTMSRYLKVKGYQVLVAEDGQKALEMAELENPDLILISMNIPVLNGFDVIQQIRQKNSALAQIPIIALTSLTMPDEGEKCLQAGANKYLSKPIQFNLLTTTMEELFTNPLMH